jgi:hypothetical protein
MYKLTDELKERVTNALNNSKSMLEAASLLGMQYKTFRRIAKDLDLWTPNQCGKGIRKRQPLIPIEDILNGTTPYFSTYKLKKRLFKEGYKKESCEVCGIGNIWNNAYLPLEMDHIDGNSTNQRIENLRILCPNCHSQTENFRGKNK